MDKNNKEYIVTKIEKYEEMCGYENFHEPIVKSVINGICLIIFRILDAIDFLPSLPEDLDIIVNQILDDAFMFGIAITSYNNLIYMIKGVYGFIMINKLEKLQKNGIENKPEVIIENNGGKTR